MAIPIGTRGWCILNEIDEDEAWTDEYPIDPYEIEIVGRSDDRNYDRCENTAKVVFWGEEFGLDDRDFCATERDAWLASARAFQRMQARAHRGMSRALDEAAKLETQDAELPEVA